MSAEDNSTISKSEKINVNDIESFNDGEDDDTKVSFTEEELKRLDKIYIKLDLRIIPAMWTLYFLTSFGSSAYGNTLTMNSDAGHSLIQTLNLTSHDISTASALSYVGTILFDVPMNIAMTKLAPQAWLSRIVFTVGLVAACYAALDNAGGIIAIRFIGGIVGAGTWPGMSYYISLWYPPHRSARRIGYYFTAAQLSASAAGLVAAGFQKMDMVRGLEGWRWLFLVYGVITIAVSLSLLVWLPDNNTERDYSKFGITRYLHRLNPYPLNEQDKILHKRDMSQYNKRIEWDFKTLYTIFFDLRLWPLVIMYFGVVGTGFGIAVFGTTLIKAVLKVSSIDVSLLYAPIWLFDLAAILLITPLSDMYKKFRPVIFSCATLVIIVGLLVCTYAKDKWSRYGGLLITGFGLGPTVPTCMAMTADIFGKRKGHIGVAVASALVSGLGNLGSVVSTYALYSGWPADVKRTYQYSNMMLLLICGVSICFALISPVLCNHLDNRERRRFAA